MKLLLGVSGGADSVAMLRLLHQLWNQLPGHQPSHLVVAHYNHALRGVESDGDQQFVQELANALQLTCHTETAAIENSIAVGSEELFRSARYRYLQATAEKIGARYVLVAHTADDNVETMLHHLFRGSGARGLSGIAPHRALGDDVVLLRPLLTFRRDQLRSGLQEIGQSWREDASNTDQRFQRNWIRSTLLPTIRTRYPQADAAILRAIANQSHLQEQLEQQASQWIEQSVVRDDDQLMLSRVDITLPVLAEVIRRLWHQMHWPRQALAAAHYQRLHRVLTKLDNDSFTLPGDIQCQTAAQHIVLAHHYVLITLRRDADIEMRQ